MRLKKSEIALPNSFYKTSGLTDNLPTIHIGAWKRTMKVRIDDSLPEESIGLPKIIRKRFMIPNQLSYQMKMDQSNIIIGPVIAIVSTLKTKISEEILDHYEDYLQHYDQIGGLVYICSAKGFNIKNKTVKGFYFDPNGGSAGYWKKGVFPYPSAIYRRTNIPAPIYKSICVSIGKSKIFNTTPVGKLKMMKWLTPCPEIRNYLPETCEITDFERLERLLDHYRSVYLKPIVGSFARGIVKLEKIGNHYHFINLLGQDILKGKKDQAEEYIFRLVKDKEYIAQQDVSFKFKNKLVDFRVIMQRDKTMQWKCNGVIARVGGMDRIYTNDAFQILMGKEALTQIYKLDEEAAILKENEMITICEQACHILDHKGHYGDLGFDLCIDQQMNIWILEINNNAPSHSIAEYVIKEPGMYEKVVTAPVSYAKALAGFS